MPALLRLRVPALALLALAACAPHAASVPPRPVSSLAPNARLLALGDRLDALRQAAHIPGLAVALVADGKVVLARGYGYANVERRVPVTADTPFNIASVSKTISAVVALRLAEQGKLDLDRRLSSFQGFAEYCAEAHGAGGIFFKDLDCDSPLLTLRRVLAMTGNGVPGSRFLYNPPLYSWLSRPMAEVAGTPFSTLVHDLVFVPAGMSRSARIHRRLPLPPELAADLATPYHLDAAGQPVVSEPPPPQGDGAAGGVISTAADLARFDLALDAGRLVGTDARTALWTPAHGADGKPFPYGLGWFVREVRGERLAWHTGLWEGAYSALYLKAPARGATLILFANSDALQYETPLDEARIEASPFAMAFLEALRP
jgi:CubicO group peptidase (beta-lactamase class C family)